MSSFIFECYWLNWLMNKTMRCQKQNRTSLITTRVANNFLQVIYSLKTPYSYDRTGNYLNYYYLNTFHGVGTSWIINNNFHCLHFYCLTLRQESWFFETHFKDPFRNKVQVPGKTGHEKKNIQRGQTANCCCSKHL